MELTTKNWLKKKVQFEKFKEPDCKDGNCKNAIPVKKQYLMSD
jgi:hypothetical protein